MPIPSTSPEWATDANFAADGDTWSGDPTKADPGVGRRAEGFEPDVAPAEWINWILNLIGSWIVWFRDLLGGATGTAEWTYPSPRVRSRVVSPFEGFGLLSLSAWQAFCSSSGDSYISPANGVNETSWTIPVVIPVGSEISSVELRVVAGAARATNGDRWTMTLWRETFTGAAVQIGSTVYDSGSSGAQTMTLTQSYTTLLTERYWIFVESPNGSVTTGSESLINARVNYVVPGPHPGA